MKNELVRLIESNMEYYLNEIQIVQLNESLKRILNGLKCLKRRISYLLMNQKKIMNYWCLFFQPNKWKCVLKKPLIITKTRFSRCLNHIILKSKASQLMIWENIWQIIKIRVIHQNQQLTIPREFCLVFSAGLRMEDIFKKSSLEEFIGLKPKSGERCFKWWEFWSPKGQVW